MSRTYAHRPIKFVPGFDGHWFNWRQEWYTHFGRYPGEADWSNHTYRRDRRKTKETLRKIRLENYDYDNAVFPQPKKDAAWWTG